MIYILFGNDTKKINSSLKKLTENKEVIYLSQSIVSKEIINEYALNISLFGESPVVVIENLLSKNEFSFSPKELSSLKDSPTIFILLEDKLLSADEKKYNKYGKIEKFEIKEIKKIPKINTFAIADAYGRGDKIESWFLYRQAIEAGIEPEAISGIIFWKIKTMILNGNKIFSLDNLQKQSKDIVSLYHNSHKGNSDFVIGLEQFILSSLSK
jgi:hypothetical protein